MNIRQLAESTQFKVLADLDISPDAIARQMSVPRKTVETAMVYLKTGKLPRKKRGKIKRSGVPRVDSLARTHLRRQITKDHNSERDAKRDRNRELAKAESLTYRRAGMQNPNAIGYARPMTGSDWRPRTCQWIDGDGPFGEDCHCGKPVKEGTSYCAEHLERCYQGRLATEFVKPIETGF